MKTLGDAIRAARSGLSQGDLADMIDWRQPAVSRWEKNLFQPSLQAIADIEDVCLRPRGYILTLAGMVTREGLTIALRDDAAETRAGRRWMEIQQAHEAELTAAYGPMVIPPVRRRRPD